MVSPFSFEERTAFLDECPLSTQSGHSHPTSASARSNAASIGLYSECPLRVEGGQDYEQRGIVVRDPKALRDVHWLKPTLVIEAQIASWTSDNLVRQASFKGLREDKKAKDVIVELKAKR